MGQWMREINKQEKPLSLTVTKYMIHRNKLTTQAAQERDNELAKQTCY